MTTGFLYDPRFMRHDPGSGHPESPRRLSAVMDYFRPKPWFPSLKQLSAEAAPEEWIRQIHSQDYLARASEACAWGAPHLDTRDVGISPESYETACLAAGGTLVLGDALMRGEIQNGFALLRPPGHHAEQDLAMGFCLLNNVAILARYLQKKHGLEKILILDWDVHHGNGTQHVFEDDPSVFYISLHQYPFYPGTGAASETGTGRGRGATLNCPMPAGADDQDYKAAFQERILPAAQAFRPEAVLISAGFDAHREDPLAGINLSTECFAWMSERVMELAAKHSAGRLLSFLEGGYNLQVLPLCVEAHLMVLSASPSSRQRGE